MIGAAVKYSGMISSGQRHGDREAGGRLPQLVSHIASVVGLV